MEHGKRGTRTKSTWMTHPHPPQCVTTSAQGLCEHCQQGMAEWRRTLPRGHRHQGRGKGVWAAFPLFPKGKPPLSGEEQSSTTQPWCSLTGYMNRDSGPGDTLSSPCTTGQGCHGSFWGKDRQGRPRETAPTWSPAGEGQGRAQGGTHAHVTRSHRSSRLSITCLVMLFLLADDSSYSLGRVEAAPGLSPPASLERKHPPHPSPPLASIPPIPLLQPTLLSSTAEPCETPAPVLTPENRWGAVPVIPSVGQTLAAPRPHWHHPEPAVPGDPCAITSSTHHPFSLCRLLD